MTSRIRTTSLGDTTISIIVDLVDGFAPDVLLPAWDPEALAPHRGWLDGRFIAPDGRLRMSFHSYLIRTPRQTILVDSCIGNDKHRPSRENWHRRRGPFLDNLRAAGVAPEAVDVVLCTHLHTDHVGWNTRLADGRWVPTFPNARYLFGEKELAFWQAVAADNPGQPVNQGSYQDSVLPVLEAGQGELVASDHRVDDTLWLEPAEGHTPGSVTITLDGGPAGRVLFSGDVVHHAAQCIFPHWNSAFCELPDRSARTRRRVLEQLADSGTLMLTGHFPAPTFGRVAAVGDGFRFDFAD